MNRVLQAALVVLVGAYICGPILDPDLWWHIVVGRWIIAHHAIPQMDYWNMFAVGHPWRAYSWAIEILFAFVEGFGGFRGLVVLKLFVAFLLCGSFCFCFSKIARDAFFGSILGIYTALACFNHFTLRPQSFVWVYFVWLGYLLLQSERSGFTGRKKLVLVALMALWANTHLTTALGILLIVGIADRKSLVPAVGCAFLGTLFTPYLGAEWLTFFQKSGHPFRHSVIAEFQPATVLQYSTGFLIVIGALLLAVATAKRELIPIRRLLLCGLFSLAGMAVTKFLPFAVIVISLVLAAAWGSAAKRKNAFGNIGNAIEKLRTLCAKVPLEGSAFLCLCIAAVYIRTLWIFPISYEVTPIDALDFIIEHKLPHPIMNSFGKGGYVLYRFSDARGVPAHLVSIDGRTNVNPPEIWEAYYAAMRGTAKWRDFMDKVQPHTILWESASPLISILEAGGEWCVVFAAYAERGYSVLVKKSEVAKRSDLKCESHGASAN